MAARWPERYPLLLESSGEGPQGRFDLLFRAVGEPLVAWEPDAAFLAELERRHRAEAVVEDTPLPFLGGYAFFLSYEFALALEPRLRGRLPRSDWPLAIAWYCPLALIRDRREGRCWLVAAPGAQALIEELRADWALAAGDVLPTLPPLLDLAEEDPAQFIAAVARARDYIAAGDVFQVNLSRRWRARFAQAPAPAALMAALRAANPAPFAGLMQWGERTVVSSSPERLLAIAAGCAESRPIAGTRPRSPDRERDGELVAELRANPKERAEHVMLVDLVRNDLGRVCEPGSVEVSALLTVESYRHVHHLVSSVRGRLRPDLATTAAIAAVFPGGTITGCPKVRAMEIIAELEGAARGPYTGGFGFLSRHGRLDLNILIRSLWTSDAQSVEFRAGCGIVADSHAGGELAESRAKAAGMLRALTDS